MVFGSPILDVAIGLVLIYLVLALACTSINEYIAQMLSMRAEMLRKAIDRLLLSSDFVAKLYDHQLIKGLVQTDDQKPSYIPAHVFSLTITDLLKLKGPAAIQVAQPGAQNPPPTGSSISTQLVGIDEKELPPAVLNALKPLADAAENDLDRFRLNIETWYDAAMERAGGWYKRRVQTIIFCVALVLCISVNADTLMLANTLWKDPTTRAQLVAAADKLTKSQQAAPVTKPTTLPSVNGGIATGEAPQAAVPGEVGISNLDKKDLADAQSQVAGVLGWVGPEKPKDPRGLPSGWGWLAKLAGILITAFAASLGAPFWFDILNKVMNIRNAGSSPAEKPRRPSEVPKPQTRIPSGPDGHSGTGGK